MLFRNTSHICHIAYLYRTRDRVRSDSIWEGFVRTSTMSGARAVRRSLVAAVAALGLLTTAAWAAVANTGVDVSSHQHSRALNWAQAKADGVTFAYIKATEGTTYTNPYFAGDWSATGSLGMYHGAYHYAHPSKGSAAAQAAYFVKVAGLQRGSGVLPPVLDLEDTGGLGVRALCTWTMNWLQTVQQLTGRDPMIYVSPYFWQSHLGNSTAFHAYPLWVASYGVSQPQVPGGWPTWSFWQSTSSGRINGIAGGVDIDHFNGDPAHLALMANVKDGSTPPGTTGTTSPTPSPTTLSLSTSKSSLYTGATATLSGSLQSAGAGLPGSSVTLWQQTAGTSSFAQVDTATTDSSGNFSFTVTPTATASYVVKWAGSTGYVAATSPAVTVTLLQAATTTMSLTSTRSLAYPGQEAVLYGELRTATGPLANRTVRLWRQPVGGTTWLRSGTYTTDARGGFSFRVTPTATASYVVKWHGGRAYAPAASAAVSVSYQPTIPTTVGFHLNRARAYAGQHVVLTGSLTSAVGNVSAQHVEVYQQDDSSTEPTLAATLSTDDNGAFSLAVGATKTTTYSVRFPGTTIYQPAAAAPTTMTLLLPAKTTLDLHAGRTDLREGRRTTLRGHLRTADGRGVGQRRVVIFRRFFHDPTWHRVRRTTTRPHGFWTLSVRPRQGAVYKAVYRGAMRFTAAESDRLRVHVS